jgi:hypothetical protein
VKGSGVREVQATAPDTAPAAPPGVYSLSRLRQSVPGGGQSMPSDVGRFLLWRGPSDDWLLSRQAAALFCLSAVSSLAIAPILLGWVHLARMSFWPRLPWEVLGIVGAIALVTLYFGMWVYWVRLDDSGKWTKRVWFLVLLLGPWYGSCAYCFAVYLPLVLRKRQMETR